MVGKEMRVSCNILISAEALNISPIRFYCLLITKVLTIFLTKYYLEIQVKSFLL